MVCLLAASGKPAGRKKENPALFPAAGTAGRVRGGVVHFDAGEMGLKLTPGAIVGASLLVNSDSGVGRDGYLSYGQGIGDGKGDALFRLFELVSKPAPGAKSGK